MGSYGSGHGCHNVMSSRTIILMRILYLTRLHREVLMFLQCLHYFFFMFYLMLFLMVGEKNPLRYSSTGLQMLM